MMTAIEPALESRTKAAQDTRPTIAADVAHVRRSECGVISARGWSAGLGAVRGRALDRASEDAIPRHAQCRTQTHFLC